MENQEKEYLLKALVATAGRLQILTGREQIMLEWFRNHEQIYKVRRQRLEEKIACFKKWTEDQESMNPVVDKVHAQCHHTSRCYVKNLRRTVSSDEQTKRQIMWKDPNSNNGSERGGDKVSRGEA